MNSFNKAEQKILLDLADKSIRYGLQNGKQMPVDLSACPERLRENGACFITLELKGDLRGCIGTLEAHQPLAIDIVQNAFNAAFRDPRFPPLTKEEFSHVTKHISVLSKPELMHFTSEEDLIRQLRPEIDGLILSEYGLCGTFLPSVWQSLPEPKIFLQHLKMKAGLPQDYWSETIQIERYTAEIIE